MVFPSAEMLRFCTMGTTFTLPLNKIQVSIKASTAVPETAPSLGSTWVRIHGIPDEARRSDCVEFISQALGKLEEIDVRSLAGSGAVRRRVLAPEPAKLPGLLPPLYFGGCGGNHGAILRVELDEVQPRSPTPLPMDGDPAGDDGASSEDDSSGDDDDGPGGPESWASPPPPAPPALAPAASVAAPDSALPSQASLPVFAPPAPLPPMGDCPDPQEPLELSLAQYGSNFGLLGLDAATLGRLSPSQTVEDSGSVGLEVFPPSSPHSAGALCYTLSPGSTPTSPAGSHPLVPATPTAGTCEPVTVVPDTPVAGSQARSQRRARQSTPSTQSTRQSARLALTRGASGSPSLTVEEQAIQLTASCRRMSGTPRSLSSHISSGSRFSVLDEVPLDHLA